MSRSIKKGIYINEKLYNKIIKKNNNIKTWSRSSTIIPDMINTTLYIHNGKVYNKLFITEEMIGCKLGEFSITRNFKSHSKKIKQKKK